MSKVRKKITANSWNKKIVRVGLDAEYIVDAVRAWLEKYEFEKYEFDVLQDTPFVVCEGKAFFEQCSGQIRMGEKVFTDPEQMVFFQWEEDS